MSEAVAIIGISGIYPEADTLHQFYLNLAKGRDSVRSIPEERIRLSGLPPSSEHRLLATVNGIDEFDHEFFNISLREAEYTDPHQRVLLQQDHELLATLTPIRCKNE